jgi:diacylglycerol kinase (ATP)
MRIHIIACAYVLFFSMFYNLTRLETIVLIMVCGSVISMEMMNTAVEVLTDKISPVYHTLAKIAKDVAAGAVFISATVAFITGIILFWDISVLEKIRLFFGRSLVNSTLLFASAIFSLVFIFSGKPRRKKKVTK